MTQRSSTGNPSQLLYSAHTQHNPPNRRNSRHRLHPTLKFDPSSRQNSTFLRTNQPYTTICLISNGSICYRAAWSHPPTPRRHSDCRLENEDSRTTFKPKRRRPRISHVATSILARTCSPVSSRRCSRCTLITPFGCIPLASEKSGQRQNQKYWLVKHGSGRCRQRQAAPRSGFPSTWWRNYADYL